MLLWVFTWSFLRNLGALGEWQMGGGPGHGREARQVIGACPEGQRLERTACYVRTGLALLSGSAASAFPEPIVQTLAQDVGRKVDFLCQLGKEGLLC